MRSLFSQLLALLARRGRTHSPRRVDWHGRPLAENAEGTVPQVGAREGVLYATFCLPSLDDATQPSARQQSVPTKGEER
jgi:hypothetical protein